MKVIYKIDYGDNQEGKDNRLEYTFRCPGCGNCHGFRTSPGSPRWTWDGNEELPTISPSILVTGGGVGGHEDSKGCCHMFIKAGKIQYLSDCTHALTGKTVDMEAL